MIDNSGKSLWVNICTDNADMIILAFEIEINRFIFYKVLLKFFTLFAYPSQRKPGGNTSAE